MRNLILLISLVFLLCFPAQAAERVTVLPVPDGGIQPQALSGNDGVVHLIYFKGDTKSGDLFYVKRLPGKDSTFSKPIRVNSKPGSAIAIGGIRGGQMALGKNNQVMVTWNSSDHKADLFSRLDAESNSFEPQRNLLSDDTNMDGGGSIAADSKGNVYVFWHAVKSGKDESTGRIFMSASKNAGATFSVAKAIDNEKLGACPCCSMKALADEKGNVYVLYRAAGNDINRDTMLLSSNNGGSSFASKKMQNWKINACPLTLFSLANTGKGIAAGWETEGKVNFCPQADKSSSIQTLGTACKYPTLAVNKSGELLYSWVEGVGWDKGGEACWQIFDSKGKSESKVGTKEGVKRWSFTATAAQPDGNFVLFY